MGFRLVQTSMTLNDTERRNSPYFAFSIRSRSHGPSWAFGQQKCHSSYTVTVKYALCQQEYGFVAEYIGYIVSVWTITEENYYTQQSELCIL